MPQSNPSSALSAAFSSTWVQRKTNVVAHFCRSSYSLGLVLIAPALSITFMTWLGRAFRLSPKLTALLAVGSSICGVSAIIEFVCRTQRKLFLADRISALASWNAVPETEAHLLAPLAANRP